MVRKRFYGNEQFNAENYIFTVKIIVHQPAPLNEWLKDLKKLVQWKIKRAEKYSHNGSVSARVEKLKNVH